MNSQRIPPAPLRALLFDLDGTCCDTHELIRTCYDHAIQTHLGRPGLRDLWVQHAGLPLETILEATYTHYGLTISSEDLAEVRATYRTHMRSHADNIAAFPEVLKTLELFKSQGVKLAIVTTKFRTMAELHLTTSNLETLFDCVVAGDDCKRCKPDPEPFLRALAILDIQPEFAAAIGDSRHDIVGAHAAGLYAIAACWGTDTRSALLAAGPDWIAESPSDILNVFVSSN